MSIANWFATYWIHSTLALGAAWLLERFVPHRLRLCEAAWKVALLLGLGTATLQLWLGIQPLGGRHPLPWKTTSAAVVTSAPRPRIHRALRVVPQAPATVVQPAAPIGTRLFVTAWLVGGGLALGGLLVSWRRFQRRLADRRELADRRVQSALSYLSFVSGQGKWVRLTQSPALDVPVAMLRREICVPERALAELDGERINALLAHELAHLSRHDPLWLLVSGVISRALALQPLNFLASRRLAAYAELACDDLAAEWTREPLALAHCLADVAGWLVEPRPALGAAAMAGTPSLLRRRVERLLATRSRESLPKWFPTAAVLGFGAALAFAPSCASFDEGAAHARPAGPPVVGQPVAAPQPQLAVIAQPVEEEDAPVVARVHRRHKHQPVVVRVETDDDDDDDRPSACNDNDNDNDNDEADEAGDLSEMLEDLPDQIADAMDAIDEARQAVSAEAMAQIEAQIAQAMQEVHRVKIPRIDTAKIEQQVQRAVAQAQKSIEQARRNLPRREELERVKEDVRRAVEDARRNLQSSHDDD